MTRLTTRYIPSSILSALKPFKTAGALDGIDYNPGSTGYLRGHTREAYYADANRIDFVIRSFATPIAWHTPDGWTRVIDNFSATTSKHQSALNFPSNEPVRTVGFQWYLLTSAQSHMLIQARDTAYNGYIIPTGQAKRTAAILQDRGHLLQVGFNPGRYRLAPDTAKRIAR